MFRNRFAKITILFAALHGVCGCGGSNSPDLAEDVTGRVTLNGRPVQEAIVVFEPQNGRPSTGVTDAEGNFSLNFSPTDKGAIPGQHTVRISKMDGEAGDELIPVKYNASSALTENVTKDGSNTFVFDLK
jgi:hypothetical protein